ncbi:MAG: Uma2 family endonuclease [Gemmatimonadetes bacterium]|nr:Uma2 family endonuclease [Gemmatimonadota bacterium]
MPNTAQRYWTVDEVWALPDEPGVRYEVVDGELLVSPSPALRHQLAVTELVGELRAYCKRTEAGVVLTAPYDVVLDRVDTLVQPDVLVLPPDAVRSGAHGAEAEELPESEVPGPALLLAVEVLSPGTARQDRLRKRPRYQRAAIPVWLVDLDGCVIEQWAPGSDRPVVCIETMEWAPAGPAEPFRLDVAALMALVHRVPNPTKLHVGRR